MHHRTIPRLLVSLLLFAAACSDTGSSTGDDGSECALGDLVDCTCEDGASGMASCGPDGVLGPCSCDPADVLEDSTDTPDTPGEDASDTPEDAAQDAAQADATGARARALKGGDEAEARELAEDRRFVEGALARV